MNETIAVTYQRLPGLFRRWELTELLQPGLDYHLEQAGFASDGSPLFAVYRGSAEENGRDLRA